MISTLFELSLTSLSLQGDDTMAETTQLKILWKKFLTDNQRKFETISGS
jgi:hypothetical protein